MGLVFNKTSPQGFQVEYWSLGPITIDKIHSKVSFVLLAYKNEAAKKKEKRSYVMSAQFELPAPESFEILNYDKMAKENKNHEQLCYEYVKRHPDFEGSVDA